VVVEYTGPPEAAVRPPEAYRVDDDATRRLRGARTPDGPATGGGVMPENRNY
jgi:hypothetical protein